MFRKIYLFCCLILIYQASFVSAEGMNQNDSVSINCSPQLRDILETIQQLPEAKKLIDTIQKEGAISIKVNTSQTLREFGAFWDPDRRIIFVNYSPNDSRGALIGSILFELHNALVNSKINYFDELAAKGQIKKEDYVQAIEHLEYQNSLNASKIAEKGIKLGILPASARLPTYRNFEEHYLYQKIGGHSAWIASNYNRIVSMRFFRP